MSTGTVSTGFAGLTEDRILATGPYRHMVIPRVVAGLPLLGIGLVHATDPAFGMRPLVEAAGLPFAAILSPIAVAIEITAGAALLMGLWARIGGLMGALTMLVAAYAHLAIDVWPNGVDNEPPILLPLLIAAASLYVAWRGAGRWSIDRTRVVRRRPPA